ncbi:MAG: ribose-phosphate diphosphokinase [Pseudomonadales bacterium]|jgi:ribose-phosphate pyrophosphokinase
MQILTFPDDCARGRDLADRLGVEFDAIDLHHFPDGESRLRLPAALAPQVVIVRSLDRPNEKLVEILMAALAARESGATEVTLVAPYLAYMRQDAAFQPGEVVSQRWIGQLLATHFDIIVTVDPHLHRVGSLSEAVPARTAVIVPAAPAIGAFLRERAPGAVLVGPDSESAQWVAAVASAAALDYAVADKERHGDRSVSVALPLRSFAGERVVLVDDLVSTGRTLVEAGRALMRAGARRVDVMATHALFVGDAIAELRAAGIVEIWSTDTVRHPTNALSLTPDIADFLNKILRGRVPHESI